MNDILDAMIGLSIGGGVALAILAAFGDAILKLYEKTPTLSFIFIYLVSAVCIARLITALGALLYDWHRRHGLRGPIPHFAARLFLADVGLLAQPFARRLLHDWTRYERSRFPSVNGLTDRHAELSACMLASSSNAEGAGTGR